MREYVLREYVLREYVLREYNTCFLLLNKKMLIKIFDMNIFC